MKKFLFTMLLLIAIPETGMAAGCGTAGGTCTATDVAVHSTQADCWVYLSGSINKVYNISPYLNGSHPAGNMIILPYCGKDIYDPFMTNAGGHKHSSSALNTVLSSYYVAPLVAPAPTPTPTPTPAATSTATTTPNPIPTPTPAPAVCERVKISKDLKYRGRDKEIVSLQNFLKKRGFFSDEATGFFGNASRDAVKNFQKSKGLPATGYVGALTRAKIENVSCESDNHDDENDDDEMSKSKQKSTTSTSSRKEKRERDND